MPIPVLISDVRFMRPFEPVVGSDTDITYSSFVKMLRKVPRNGDTPDVVITHLLLSSEGYEQFATDPMLSSICKVETDSSKTIGGYLGTLKGPSGNEIHILTDVFLDEDERFAVVKAAIYNIIYN